jgi:hypothetical protein
VIFIATMKGKEKKLKNRLEQDLCEDLQWLGFNSRGKTRKEVQELATSRTHL